MTALVKVSNEDLKMRGYNDLKQSIFDVKSAIFGKTMPDKVDEGEEPEKPSSFKVINKQTLRLRNTAVLLHKQAVMEFKYEKNMFGKMKLGGAKKFNTSAKLRKRLKLKKESDKKLDTSSLRNLIDDLIKKFLRKGLLKIKSLIKRIIGKKGIKFIRSIGKIFRRLKIGFKLFRRFAFKPFRQARRFVQSLPKKAWNLSKNLVKKGASVVKTQFLKRGGIKGMKSSAGKVVKNVSKTLLKRFKLFYKAGPGRFIKKIPLVGALIDFGINYFIFKEPLKKALFKAVGAGIGTALGGVLVGTLAKVVTTGILAPVLGPFAPIVGGFLGGKAGAFVGGLLGGIAGDFLGGMIYKFFNSGGAKEGARIKKPQLILVGEGNEDEWIVPKSRLGWWIAPLLGDVVEEAISSEKQENIKVKREVDKIPDETIEKVEEKETMTWKPGKIFDPIIKLTSFMDSKSTNINEAISVIKKQEKIINGIQPVNTTTESISTINNTTESSRPTLNNIEPDPEPNYAEVIPPLLERSMVVIENEPELLPFPIPVGGGSESDVAYAVWGRKVVGN